MEADSACAAPISGKFYSSNHLKMLHINQSQGTCDDLKHVSLDEIGLCLTESLQIGDEPKISPNTVLCKPFDSIDKLNVISDADLKDFIETDTTKVTSQKELSKSATFPCSLNLPFSTIFTCGECGEDVDDADADINLVTCESSKTKTAPTRSISLPTTLKLVSAIKGTREKLGVPRDKLSVTWAPDVYDPPPSAPSTAVINPKQRRKSERKKSIDAKKNGKNKQKKKSSKGSNSSSSSRDKRPIHKNSRGDNIFYKSFGGEEVEGFDCGSTFLKTSVTNLHFSMAEAT